MFVHSNHHPQPSLLDQKKSLSQKLIKALNSNKSTEFKIKKCHLKDQSQLMVLNLKFPATSDFYDQKQLQITQLFSKKYSSKSTRKLQK